MPSSHAASDVAPETGHAFPLLATKLYIPRARPELVPRPRLLEQLTQGLSGRLILVSGPAGFGKTALLCQWLAELDYLVAWLTLDAEDNNSTRFLRYLVAALQRLVPSVGKATRDLLQSPQLPPVEAALTVAINELCTLASDAILVLDDYHTIDAAPVHAAVTFLTHHLPPTLHLVIATRVDPPLSLAGWRARGQMAEIRADDLRFTADETTAFLNHVMRLNLSAEDVATLGERTEGWIVGLQMAALSMRGRQDVSHFVQSFTGSHHYVLDYLVTEVLDSQPPQIQQFLLQTSILDRLSGPLCEAITGHSGGQSMLERLESANLFLVPLDDERRWYRCWSGLSIIVLLRHNWVWGAVAAVLLAMFTVGNILSQPASARSEGLPLVFDLLWIGVIYGLIDALLLSVLPVLATRGAFSALGWTDKWPGKILVGVIAFFASLLVSVSYHLGYPECRVPGALFGPTLGNGAMTLGYVLTNNPIAAILSHMAMHIAGVLRGPASVTQLPPHY